MVLTWNLPTIGAAKLRRMVPLRRYFSGTDYPLEDSRLVALNPGSPFLIGAAGRASLGRSGTRYLTDYLAKVSDMGVTRWSGK